MKTNKGKMTPAAAKDLATAFNINLTLNFYELSIDDVIRVTQAADVWNYRAPKNANGSRGRYFFEYMKRSANKAE